MSQSRKMSATEAIVSQSIGWVLAVLLWAYVVAPMACPQHATLVGGIVINASFFALSVIRHYIVRRFFECLH